MSKEYTFYEWTIRPDMVEALERYIATGYPIGDFLTAVLSNDLMSACSHADGGNKRNIPAFCGYLYNEAPMMCHGSVKRVQAWQEIGGNAGIQEMHELTERRQHADSMKFTQDDAKRLDHLEAIARNFYE